jgi:Glycosyl transferase family 2
MWMGSRIVVVVPAYDEEPRVARVVGQMPPWVDDIVLVDDASRDKTAEAARATGDRRLVVVRHGSNRGVGAAIATGYRRAAAIARAPRDVFVVMAGDAQMDPRDLPALVTPIARGEADYVKGNRFRFPGVARAMPLGRLIGGLAFSWATSRAIGVALSDSQCGYTAIAREACTRLDLGGLWPRYGYPNDLLSQLALRCVRIAEAPVRPVYADEVSRLKARDVPVVAGIVVRAWIRRMRAVLVATIGFVAFASNARAAPPWVDRNLTLPAGDWAFDFGFGIADSRPDLVEGGINLEMGVGLTDAVELGVRTGVRFGSSPADRFLQPDVYGRLFDRQYFDGDSEAVANPEVRVRGALVRLPVFELALEGRLIVPIEHNTAGLLFGVPLAFHLGDRVRLDIGAFMPIIIGNGTIPSRVAVNTPLDVWIQATRRLWLGPMTGFQIVHVADPPPTAHVSLGFGLGYQITHYLDFKTMILFPDLADTSSVGAGAGVQLRIE